jgi:hypothetical protein
MWTAAIACTALAALMCAVAAPAAPVPRIEQQRIVASFGRTLLPTWLPPGFIYSRWITQPGSAGAFPDTLIVDFGRHGALLEWAVESTADPDSVTHYHCKPGAPPLGKIFRIGSRKIVYATGARGADATLCMGKIAVVAWTAGPMPGSTLARFAASAQTVG